MDAIMDTHHHNQHHSLYIPNQLTSLSSNDLIYDTTATGDLLSFDPYATTLTDMCQPPMRATIQTLAYTDASHQQQHISSNNSAEDLTFLSLSSAANVPHLQETIEASYFNQDEYSMNECNIAMEYSNQPRSEAIADHLESFYCHKQDEFSSAFIVNSGKWINNESKRHW